MRFGVLLLGWLVFSFSASAQSEKLPPPRVFADFDLTPYKNTAQAKTTTIQKGAIARPTTAQPAYLGFHLEGGNHPLRISEIDAQSPASKVDLQVGDVVKSLNGKAVANAIALRELMKTQFAGDTLKIQRERSGKMVEISITAGGVSSPLTGPDPSATGGRRPVMGIQTAPADRGVKITSITANSGAEKAELKVGDVIISVAGTATPEPERLTESLSGKRPGDKVTVKILRDDKELSKEVTLGGQGMGGGGPKVDPAERSWDTRAGNTFRKPVYRLAVFPISFSDTTINEKSPVQAWEDSLFSEGTYINKDISGRPVYGSLNDYYREQSLGTLKVTGKVFAPVKATKKRAEYPNLNPRTVLLGEVIDLVRERDGKDALKDFDGIFFLYAGETGNIQRNNLFWPHRSVFTHKNERWNYFICPEGGTRQANISTIAHEFGHMLGLPDLYAKPENPGSEGVGAWCAMSQQVRNGRPQHFSAWSKEQMGWMKPVIIDPEVPQKLILSPVEGTSSECFKVLVHADGSEYLLLENRKKTGFDTDLPGEGLLIWRVYEGKPILEESHGVLGPTGPRSYPGSVPFPSKANNSFTPYTTPSSKSLKGGGKEVHLTNIRRLPDGRIVFQIGYEFF